MKKSKAALEEEARFFEFVSNYPLFDDNGYMDLERVTCHLSYCFGADDKLEGSPQPRDMYYLLFDLLEEYSDYEGEAKWIQYQKLIDWTPELAHFYPDGIRTYIHPLGMLFVWELWIFYIGYFLQEVKPKSKKSACDYWVNKKWVFVSTFFSSMKREMKALTKKLDYESFKLNGYSRYESVLLSKVNKIEYKNAAKELSDKGKVFNSVLQEIQDAVQVENYYEAVVLAENFVTEKLTALLYIKQIKPMSTLHKLIEQNKSHHNNNVTDETMEQLNSWRKDRNKVIHGRFSQGFEKESLSKEEFSKLLKNVANQAMIICKSIDVWYFDSIHDIDYKVCEVSQVDNLH